MNFRRPSFFALSLLALPLTAHAVGTRSFQLDSLDRLAGGEAKGVQIGADGVLRPGLRLRSTPLANAGSALCALKLKDGSVLVGTGPSGQVFRVDGDKVELYAETESLAVTSLLEVDGQVLATTLPDGKLLRLEKGKATALATIKDAALWAAVSTPSGLFVAAGGVEGKGAVYKIEKSGAANVYFQSDEPHLVSLIEGKRGELYVGSSGNAVLYRLTGQGKGEVVADFPGQELKALQYLPAQNGRAESVYVIANDYPEPPEPPRRNPNAAREAAGPSGNVARPRPGKGALYKVSRSGVRERLMGHNDTHYLSLQVDPSSLLASVGTAVEGRIFQVDDAHVVSQLADTDERQIVAASADGASYWLASDPVVLHRQDGKGERPSWTSAVLDAQLPARFGQLSFQGTGAVEVSTRSGNTKKPDGTWSDWSPALRGPAAIKSPAARYLQVRVRFGDERKDAQLSQLTIPFVTDNARAIVTEVNVDTKSLLSKEPSGSVPSSGGEPTKAQGGKTKLSWKVDNPDADSLRYRLFFRKEGQLSWREMLRSDELHTRTDYEWDASVLSEGRYRVRVEASDELANPADQVERHSAVSEPFVVDHTAPVIERVALEGGKLVVRARDGVSPIVRIDVAVDGRPEFRPLSPRDGLFDSLSESAEVPLSTLAGNGRRLYFVRVVDAAGNIASQEIEGP